LAQVVGFEEGAHHTRSGNSSERWLNETSAATRRTAVTAVPIRTAARSSGRPRRAVRYRVMTPLMGSMRRNAWARGGALDSSYKTGVAYKPTSSDDSTM